MFHVIHADDSAPTIKRCTHTGVCPDSHEHFTKRAKAEAYLLDEAAQQLAQQQQAVMVRELRQQAVEVAERVLRTPELLPTAGFRGLTWTISGLRNQSSRTRELLAGTDSAQALMVESARQEINNGLLEDAIKAKWRAWLEHEYATEDLSETQRDIIFHRVLRTDEAAEDKEKRYKKEAQVARAALVGNGNS